MFLFISSAGTARIQQFQMQLQTCRRCNAACIVVSQDAAHDVQQCKSNTPPPPAARVQNTPAAAAVLPS